MSKLIDGDPQRLGGYWLAGRLGAGGQGVVYEAYAEDGRRVAIKVLHGDRAAELGREAAAAQRVASFCTAAVLETNLDGPRPYIVSEYVEGPSLRKAVTGGRRFRDGDLHRLATAIATALTAIHDAGVVHRDLKPDNVLLGPDGPRVIDFGIARTTEMSLTTTGLVTGTPTYMAPEVFTGQRAGTPADVFAWGGILIYAATGADPFEAESLGGVMHRVLSAVPDLSALPEPLRPLVAATLSKDPHERPTARQLLLALVSGDARLDTARLLAEGNREAAQVVAPTADPALGTLAEEAYRLLDSAERELAPEVFLRLVAVTERGELSIRPADLAELLEGRPLPEVSAVTRILEVFGYLLARSGEEVSLARPALPHAWPRYRRWVEANRDGLAVHREIRAAARRWHSAGRKDGDLFHGSSLENALQWAATARRNITLSAVERDFLEAGAAAGRRRARRTRLASLSLAGLLVIALAASGLAIQQGMVADERADQIAGQLRKSEADRLATLAAATRRTDPGLAMLFSAAAWRLDRTTHTRAELTDSMALRDSGMFRDPATGGDTIRTLSADGRLLVSFGQDEARIWDLRTGRRTGLIRPLGLGGEPVADVRLSPSGRTLVASTNKRASAWDMRTGKLLRTWPYRRMADLVNGWIDVVFSREGKPVVVQSDGSMALDVRTGNTTEVTVAGGVRSPDGQWVARLGTTKVRLVNLKSGAVEYLGDLDGAGTQGVWNKGGEVTFSGDGRLIATMSRNSIQFWRMSDTQLVSTAPVRGDGHDGAVPEGAFDGRTFRYLIGDQVFSVDVADLGGPKAETYVNRVTLTPDGTRMVVDSEEGGTQIRRVGGGPTGEKLPSADSEAFSKDGRLIATVEAARGKVTVLEGGKRTALPFHGDGLEPHLAAFSPDGSLVALSLGTPDDGVTRVPRYAVEVWDWRSARRLWRADQQDVEVMTVFSPDGKRLGVAGGQVSILDAATGKPIGRPFGGSGKDGEITELYFARSGRAVTVRDSRMRVTTWDIATRRRNGLVASGVTGFMAFSPREDLIATWARNGRVRLFDPVNMTSVGTLRDIGGGLDPDSGYLQSAAFTADGSTLVTADNNGVIRRHPVAPDKVLAAVCARVGRSLTEAEWRTYVPSGLPYQKVCP